ncbi:hypothetical protein SARC_14007 [Sphaeroforma arctica JP610]|uniref:Ras-GEF domain-containing protein n=1 Tax=Sphaeroforma arctica JP610 TaxID=667725 RepID=A0A0L0F9N5_9EUKA|nr:hypothetical protein SARC_14007 [Sphaeroforma arctica JP610]KNC73437.1 hypothetical protein SARC_14007 [Sphaeroforma arctica JP610]|eukprot:XP_014147339.1 hypothetical protein SARC_14007 [Sphaeroforma arctica JP610]
MMHECMDTAWQKKDKATRAPTVLTTIAFFNEVAEFAMTCIVQCMHPVARLKAMIRLIDIMVELLMLHNLSSAKAILAALQSTPVYRLKQTWMSLSKDAQKVFDECAMLLSEENNMAQMRKVTLKPK